MGLLKDFDCSNVKREQATAGNEAYNVIRPGMSYVGICRNPNCKEAFQKTVVCNKGGGQHLVNDDLVNNVITCPMCKQPILFQHISLFRCKADVIVHSHNEEVTPFEAKGDEIIKIGKKVGGEAFDHYLMSVVVKKIEKDGTPDCVIC